MPRIPKAPVLVGAGLLSAGLLGLTGTGTLSAITAQVLTQPNTVGLGRMVLELQSDGSTCTSTDDVSNVFTCSTIQPLTGRADLLPGDTVAKQVVATNRGTVVPTSFTLTPGTCTPTGSATGADATAASNAICDQLTVRVLVNGAEQFNGTVNQLAAQHSIPLPAPAKGAAVTVQFTTSVPTGLTNAYQGLGVSMPMTWSFQQ